MLGMDKKMTERKEKKELDPVVKAGLPTSAFPGVFRREGGGGANFFL